MSTATNIETTAPKTRKPRTKKPVQSVEQPKCQQCGRELSWRDLVYAKGTDMCKVCHQKAERRRLRGAYVPREQLPRPTMQYGADKTAKLTARPGQPRPAKPASVPSAPKQHVARASRRAQARKAAEKGRAA